MMGDGGASGIIWILHQQEPCKYHTINLALLQQLDGPVSAFFGCLKRGVGCEPMSDKPFNVASND